MSTTLYKLEDITREYTIFEDNQILTKKQLNEVVDYFEDQSRMTRTLLLGVGLVCGLEVSHDSSSQKITIGGGVAVTTDGDLLKLTGKTNYTGFKAFDDSNAKYPPFRVNDTQIPLWKLFTGNEDPAVSGVINLSAFSTEAVPVGQVAAILYLEFFQKDPDTCTTVDCDNLGCRQVARQHVLLVRKADLDNIISNHDTIFAKYGNGKSLSAIPSLHMPRVVFSPSNTKSLSQIYAAYAQALNGVATSIITQLDSLYSAHSSLLDPLTAIDTGLWKSRLEQLLITNVNQNGVNIQYVYDFVRDICDTYNEMLAAVRKLFSICCPSLLAFPKHIMLSEVVKTLPGDPPVYRHEFYPTPIHEHGKGLGEIRMILARLNTLIMEFKLPATGQGPVRITPSYLLHTALSKKAIPYYYEHDKVYQIWNYNKHVSGTPDENLSYHSSQYSAKDHVVNPLKYDFDEKDFLRIEGHVGRDIATVLREINSLKETHGLAFDVVALRLNQLFDEIDFREYMCYFEDLEVLLKAWLSELNCLWKDVAGFFSRFSVKNEAAHEDYVNTQFIATRAAATTGVLGFATTDRKTQESLFTKAYKSNLVVANNVSKTQDSIGEIFLEVNKTQPTGCPADSKDKIIESVKNTAGIATWKPENIELAVNIPAYILSNANVLAFKQPSSVFDITDATIAEFRKTMSEMCKRTKTFRTFTAGYFTSANYVKQGYESQYAYLLDKLEDGCCAAEKLEELFMETVKRKNVVLRSTLLSEYCRKHPGIAHTAGVPIGGTFILVYEDRPSGRFIPGLRNIADTELRVLERVSDSSATSPTSNALLANIPPLTNISIGDIDLVADLDLINVPGITTRRYTVVADFSLPYLCCSDCPPMTFVFQESKVDLRIVDHICLDDATQPVEFFVKPADGQITADKGGDAIVTKDGKVFFDAQKLPSSLHGVPISFLVNGQETEATTTVYRKVKPAFALKVSSVDRERGIAVVAFDNQTEVKAGENVTYRWDFGDNNNSSDRSPIHQYKLPVNDSFIVEVILIAGNGPCVQKSEPVRIDFTKFLRLPPDINIRNNAGILGGRIFSLTDSNQPLIATTRELYNTVLNDIRVVLAGNRNVIFDDIAKVNNETHTALRRDQGQEAEALANLMMSQIFLALDILQDQTADVPKFLSGTSGPQTEVFKLLNSVPAKLKTATTAVPNFDKDNAVSEYFSTYLESIPDTRPVLKDSVAKALEILR